MCLVEIPLIRDQNISGRGASLLRTTAHMIFELWENTMKAPDLGEGDNRARGNNTPRLIPDTIAGTFCISGLGKPDPNPDKT